jgi:hypothetical protein
MSRTGWDDMARLNYRGRSRQTTSQLAVLNKLRPPKSVPNHMAATCDILSLCSDPSPVDDTKSGLLKFHIKFLGFSRRLVESSILMFSILPLLYWDLKYKDIMSICPSLMTFLGRECFFTFCFHCSQNKQQLF